MLDIKKINKSFKQKTVVNSIDLFVRDGEFLSLLGPSGCGKTTLLRIIAGHEFADSGTLALNGNDITHIEPHLRDVHTVFQRYALFPHLNIFDNVAFGLRCSKIKESEIRKRVEEMLGLANLGGQGQRSIASLSGGEQQRVALVRALIKMPKLLLLDEPLGALDLKLRLQLQHELTTIQKRVKTTFIFVTHDQQEALNMSDRVAVMNEGKIEQLGTPKEIYEHPNSLFVAHFVGGINKISGQVRKNTSGESVFEVPEVGSFFVQAPVSTRATLCVRPEKLSLYKNSPPNQQNYVDGIVKAQTYLGTHTQYDVRLKNGATFTVFQQNQGHSKQDSIQLEDRVTLGWSAHHSHVFELST